ncbi:MAG: flagellar hook-associated protein FlgK [Elusimicrobiales bacterium]|nr:flagellar hook-associated protein FlgK [Elusimicrobiales bacterium]
MGNFTSLNIGLTALRTFKQYQEILGNNITNVSNENYKRREAIIEPIRGPDNLYGGVKLSSIKRIVDYFIESEVRTSISDYEKHKILSSIISEVEENLSALGEGSILDKLTDFWKSLEEVSKNSQDITLRREVVSKAKDFTQKINSTLNKNYFIESKIIKKLNVEIKEVNNKLKEIAELNQEIKSAILLGNDANSLKDIRDSIVDEVSKYINIEVSEKDEEYKLVINGIVLVNGNNYFSLESKVYEENGTKNIDFFLKEYGVNVDISSGKFSAYNRALNDIENINLKIKQAIYFLTSNNVNTFNYLHKNGYDIYGNLSNKDFFVIDETGGITVNPLIEAEPGLFAASKTPYISDGTNASELASFLKSSNFNNSSIFNFISEISSATGYLSQNYNNLLEISNNIKNSNLSKRDMISGVSIDEEMLKLLEIQKYYSVVAKYVTISNEILEEMIRILK